MLRAEHPRPQFVRNEWQNLNGEWEFEIDHGKSGKEKKALSSGQIRWNHCRSVLSGKRTVWCWP